MNIERIDHLCDLFEARLRAGEKLSPEQFLEEQRLPAEDRLLAELRKVEREFGTAIIPPEGDAAAGVPACDPYAATVPPAAEGVGTVVGPYKLLQKIGEGGMGVVYMAEQTEPVSRRVALKIIKPGMDSRQVIARFEAERQALALMDHPNIARVVDAGTTERGRPYFVMELVKGVPITKYCDEKHLNTRERLELFVPICQAVQHAHQKGIIHRDIKPTNVLVAEYDDRPVPKIIDFGVAKAISQRLTERTLFTQYGQIVGTIDYMSPEQASFNQLDVDTRSDVYSLGVLLYELLTGETPFDRKRLHAAAFDELLRIIRDEEPPRPSMRLSSNAALPTIAANRRIEPRKLSLLVRGELDWIVMKALEKDRGRRYETANGLALDVQRYLADEQVAACPPSAGYRLRKLARRHRTAVVTSATILLSLILGLIGTAWQSIRATHEARRADDRAADAIREKERADENATALLAAKNRADAKAAEALHEKQRATQKTDEALAAKRLSDRHLYIAHMNLAQSAWEGSHVAGVRKYLDRWVPSDGGEDLRGFEWYYFDRLCRRDLLTFEGHAGGVLCVAFSPDGMRLASAGRDRTVRLWDATTGRQTGTLEGHRDDVRCVSFSADGTRIASAGWDATVRIWDAATGQETATLEGHQGFVDAVAFSTDGTRILSASCDRTVKLWDAVTGQETTTFTGHAGQVRCVAVSPDGAQIASGSADQTVRLWDTVTARESTVLIGHGADVTCVAFSPDGTRIVSGSADRTIRLWVTATGQEVLLLRGHADRVHGVAFSPDGTRIASGSADRTIRLWDAATGTEVATLKGHLTVVNGVTFSLDGMRIASASDDRTVKLWNESTERMTDFQGNALGTAVAFSSDGMRIASAGEDDTVKIWDAATGVETLRLKGHTWHVNAVAFSPDSRWIVSASSDQTVRVWNSVTGQVAAILRGHVSYINALAINSDGTRIASASFDGTIKIWDMATWRETATLNGHAGGVTCVAFSPDGMSIASASRDESIKFWDLATSQETATLKGHDGVVTCVAFSPDGMRIASAGDDQTVKLWDAATGQKIMTLDGHTGKVTCVAFDRDGRRIASSSDDWTVKIWDPSTGQETATLKGSEGPIHSVAFSPDGARIAAGGRGRIIPLWDARPHTPELNVEDWAVELLRSHLHKGRSGEQLIDAIVGDRTISPEVRQLAVRMARGPWSHTTVMPPPNASGSGQ